jgi:hypothetical protein
MKTLTRALMCFFIFNLVSLQLVQASSKQGLKQIIDEFNYAVNVEWDQQDQAFIHDRKEEFVEAVAQLKASGYSTQDLITELKLVFNKESSKDRFELLVAKFEAGVLNEQDMFTESKAIVIADSANGTSWLPPGRDVLMFIGPIVVFVAIVAVIWAITPPSSGTGTYDPNYQPYCPFYCLWENQHIYGYYDRWNLPPECYICSPDQIYY